MPKKYDPSIHHRRSIRIPGYDYSQDGWYFVTICTQNRKCLFGEITHAKIQLYEYGRIVEEYWKWLARQFKDVYLDEYVVMPNHLHGIIIIRRGGSRTAPTPKTPECNKPLGRIIGAFKTVSTKRINIIRKTPASTLWQRNYYEHIIRNEDELNRFRRYITDNPANWQTDEENPYANS
ncbi:hypothetical protein ES708_29788 [subsurface metagenome]